MDAKELMLGDYIYDLYGNKAIVRKLEDYNEHAKASGACIELVEGPEEGYTICLYGQIEPIPLTPEILEKNSFEEYGANIYWHPNIAPEKHVMLQKTPADEDLYGMVGECASVHGFTDIKPLLNENAMPTVYHGHFKYVHELQHALRLAGIKKEIVL